MPAPVKADYGPDELSCQFKVRVPTDLKLAITDLASASGRCLADEARIGLMAWVLLNNGAASSGDEGEET